MSLSTFLRILAIALLITLSSGSADAAEVRLRGDLDCGSRVVRLTDIAEITGATAAESGLLSQVELFPAPGLGKERIVNRQEVQELNALSGLSLRNITVTGPRDFVVRGALVTVFKTSPQPKTAEASQALSTSAIVPVAHALPSDSADFDERLQEALLDYLNQQSANKLEWGVSVKYTRRQEELLSAATNWKISGGKHPFVGLQALVISAEHQGKAIRVPLNVTVTASQAVVSLARNLPSGTILQAADVELRPVSYAARPVNAITDVQQVLGQELARTSPAGLPLATEFLKAARLVKLGQAVTVRSVGAGVMVTAQGKALADGAQGDMVLVELLETKEKLQARVKDRQVVEIYATGAQFAPIASP